MSRQYEACIGAYEAIESTASYAVEVHVSEQRGLLSHKTAWLAIRTYGEFAGLPVDAHPHMLHHACGFALVDQSADTRLIQDSWDTGTFKHTVRYTATDPARFERLWR